MTYTDISEEYIPQTIVRLQSKVNNFIVKNAKTGTHSVSGASTTRSSIMDECRAAAVQSLMTRTAEVQRKQIKAFWMNIVGSF